MEGYSLRLLNEIWYLFLRNNWMIDPRFYLSFYKDVVIDRPIFLLGNQGGGLTLVSRILRRNREVVSVTGNCGYWSGADEMQNVMGAILPAELTGIKHKAPPHPTLSPPRSWSYASNALLSDYRKTENDWTEELEYRLKKVIKYIVGRYSKDVQGRFVDKSQVYTVRLSFLHRLLRESNPKYILVTRNPYVECPRAAMGKAGDMKRYANFLSWEERLELCIQHWRNSIQSVQEDMSRLGIRVLIVQLEKILNSPLDMIREICNFAELDFVKDMLPQQDQRVPFGSHFRDRWFPLRRDVNTVYRGKISEKDLEIIENQCGQLAEELGYTKYF